MKFINKIAFALLAVGMLFATTSCEIEEIPNPNGSSVNDILNDASKSELQTLITGTEALLRSEVGFYVDVTSIIGRDYWYFTGSDPRYTGELLGRENAVLDNAGFYGARPFSGRYSTVKNTNILLEAAANSTTISDADRNAYTGFAKTMQAYELHIVLNLQYQNGIRLNVADPDNLGGFVSYDESLAGIANLLNEGNTALAAAGEEFPFALSSGFAGFDTPASFAQFNRGLAARIAAYQGSKGDIAGALSGSFLDLAGNFMTGPARPYSTAGGEMTNGVFRPTNQADAIIAHPMWVAGLEAGDDRVSKVAMRDAALTLDGLTGDHDVTVYNSLSSPIHFIRNEELILLYAEANIGSNNAEAESALNVIRTGHGLAPVSGLDDAGLVDELLKQRQYSLFGEGHRWVDMRRFGRLGQLPLDRAGDDVWEQMPRPVTEG